MNIQPRFETIPEKRYIGKWISMSFADNKTKELWQSFMPRRGEIKNNIGTELYSIEVYPPQFFVHFDPSVKFEKWAAMQVHDLETVPDGMDALAAPGGLYAIFVYKGPASSAPETYQYIFETWLPKSGYALDNRPHFAVMGEKYKNNDPSSEEELWIQIK